MKAKSYLITPTGSVDTGTTTDGFTAYGTLNNCAHGYTPWGTYLTCEENWNGYFGAHRQRPLHTDRRALRLRSGMSGQRALALRLQRQRLRLPLARGGRALRLQRQPQRANRFGWVVEIDPFDPGSMPVKRTALGRFKHESAQVVVDDDEPRRVLHGRRRAQRVHLQVRLRAQPDKPATAQPTATCSTTARCTSPSSMPTAPGAMAAADSGPERPDRRRTASPTRPRC